MSKPRFERLRSLFRRLRQAHAREVGAYRRRRQAHAREVGASRRLHQAHAREVGASRRRRQAHAREVGASRGFRGFQAATWARVARARATTLLSFPRFRGFWTVRCPETRNVVMVELDRDADSMSAGGEPQLRVKDCTDWPEKEGCEQKCLSWLQAGLRKLRRPDVSTQNDGE